MAHIGKFYPRWNPARLFVAQASYPFWWPTEFNWQVDGWYGPDHGGAPIAGRGLVPYEYDPTAPFVQFRKEIFPTLGPPLVFTLTIQVDPDPTALVATWDWAYDGVLQQQYVDNHWSPNAVNNLGVTASFVPPLPGATFYFGNFFNIVARKWSDAAPPPPASSPF